MYIKKLRKVIAEIVSRKEGRRSTLKHYWIVDTQVDKALAFIYPVDMKVNPRWLERKLEANGWQVISVTKLKNSGRGKDFVFYNFVVSMIEVSE